MEGQNKAKSVFKHASFQIPIDKFKAKLPEEATKEKENEIIDLLLNHNEISSFNVFFDIRNLMYQACHRGDLELLEIYLSEEVEVNTESFLFTFKINKNKKTASLFRVLRAHAKLIVPRTIEYEGEEYLVTSIIGSGDTDKYVKEIEFPTNSSVRTIYEESFSNSLIQRISILPNLVDLKDGWCYNAKKLMKITVSESNDRFLFKDEKYLIGKSGQSEDFDILYFVRPDIEEMEIPSNIKIISSYAFDCCKHLSKVEFESNSKLQTIGKHAFAYTNITHVSIPSSVSTICESAFYRCEQLTSVEIPKISNLRTIGEYAFTSTDITEIYIPSNLVELKDGWCCNAQKLMKITISESNDRFLFKDEKYLIGKSDQSEDFDILYFVRPDIEEIEIPSNIKIIASYAFECCEHLSKVGFASNSKLQTIGKHAFAYTNITHISIPSSVSTICENAFYRCEQLRSVKIMPNSNLQTIKARAFSCSDITEIYIPSSVSTICKSAFKNCDQLSKVEIAFNSNLARIGKSAFADTNITEIYLPSSVSTICKGTFKNCSQLSKVEIPTNSNLRTIEERAFADTNITEIYLPSNFIELKEKWHYDAKKLIKISISESNDRFLFKDEKYLIGKSDIQSDDFDILLFVRPDIEEIEIPSYVKIISSDAFINCGQLSKVEFAPNSKLRTIEAKAFSYKSITEIYLPSSVSTICERAFEGCLHLSKVEIPTNSNLRTIEDLAFLYTNITEIYIPSNLIELEEGWCCKVRKLMKITVSELNNHFLFKDDKYFIGKSDPEKEDFDILLFVRSDIEEVEIPSNIEIISSLAFDNCHQLSKIKFAQNSKLRKIDEHAFSYTNITEISIPSYISTICDSAFFKCKQLSKVEFSTNSNLETIGEDAFSETNITQIYIPPSVSVIYESAFSACEKLSRVEFSTNSNLLAIREYAFSFTNITSVIIPSSVSTIGDNAFETYHDFLIFEISDGSNLHSLNQSIFQSNTKVIIMIPQKMRKVLKINDNF